MSGSRGPPSLRRRGRRARTPPARPALKSSFAGVAVDRDDRGQAGGDRRQQAVARVLHDDASAACDAEPVQRQHVDVGRGLLGRDDVTGEHQELGGIVPAHRVLQDGPHRWLGRCRAHRQLPACSLRLPHDPLDARSSRQAAGLAPSRHRCSVLRLCHFATSAQLARPIGRQARLGDELRASATRPCAPCRHRWRVRLRSPPRTSAPAGRTPRTSG